MSSLWSLNAESNPPSDQYWVTLVTWHLYASVSSWHYWEDWMGYICEDLACSRYQYMFAIIRGETLGVIFLKVVESKALEETINAYCSCFFMLIVMWLGLCPQQYHPCHSWAAGERATLSLTAPSLPHLHPKGRNAPASRPWYISLSFHFSSQTTLQ